MSAFASPSYAGNQAAGDNSAAVQETHSLESHKISSSQILAANEHHKTHSSTATMGVSAEVGGKAVAEEPAKAAQAQTSLPPKKSFPPFDPAYYASDFFWLVICFGFFYFFMSRVVLPRIGGIIETRRDRIAADLDQAAKMKAEADAAVKAYKKALADAREESKAMSRKTAEEERAKAEAERKSAEAELDKKLAQSEAQVVKMRDEALTHVDEIAEEAAADIVQKISGEKADKMALAQAVKAAAGAGSAVL